MSINRAIGTMVEINIDLELICEDCSEELEWFERGDEKIAVAICECTKKKRGHG